MNIDNALEYIPSFFKVLTKAGENSVSQMVPMTLWPAQSHYIENCTHRDIILKNRQQGMSTGVMARDSHKLFTIPYQRQVLITHDDETSEYLFLTVSRFYDNLPEDMKPRRDWASGRRIRFPTLDSYKYIDSAKSDAIGIGHGLSSAHLSEVARWPMSKEEQLFADITQTVPPKGYVTIESTPRGRRGLFYNLYMDAKDGKSNFKPFFYPWWWDVTCVIDDLSWMTDEKAEMLAVMINESMASFLKHEKFLQETYHLTKNQIAFRRQKIAELKFLAFQEYPESDIDCWLSSEMAVIDGTTLRPYFDDVKSGREYDDLTIWKDAIGGEQYIMGVDVASGSARDYSVASVLRTKNMEYVARVRGKINTDMFAEQILQLGLRYNNALVAVERIGHGHSVLRVLLGRNYPNLYYHMDYDEFQHMNVSDAGWKTSVKTKPLLINGMITAFAARDLISYSENLLLESSGLVWEGGVDSRVKTISGGHDDEFMTVAIAIQVREASPLLDNIHSAGSVSNYVTV